MSRIIAVLAAFALPAAAQFGSLSLGIEDESIRYETPSKNDPVALLQNELGSGRAKLAYAGESGYLLSVLQALKVPVSSQTLVFSKTSFQHQIISPQNPRALYFNDEVYVGWVRDGEVIEVSSVDPVQGPIYYTLDQQKAYQPKFTRRDDCLQCHLSPKTLGVPGHVLRSVYPDREGFPQLQAGSFSTDDSSPMKERWGGWYVTGMHGAQRHMGNIVARDKDHPDQLDLDAGANITSLKDRVDLAGYLSPQSDLVALMVLGHQTKMHNLFTRMSYETRMALSQQEAMNRAFHRPLDEFTDSTRRRIASVGDELVKYMLFTEEAKLSEPVRGTSSYQAEFARKGPRDKAGRSLRDFDLKQRLFRYPCSFLIYSPSFDQLPKLALDYVYRKLLSVLTGKETGKAFQTLTPEDRKAILEILLETKPGLPDYWRETSTDSALVKQHANGD